MILAPLYTQQSQSSIWRKWLEISFYQVLLFRFDIRSRQEVADQQCIPV